MSKMIKHLLSGIFSGTFIGLMISFVISWRVGLGEYFPGTPIFMAQFDTELEAFGWSIALWSIVGMMFSVANLIYDKDDWSILKQMSIHFISTYVGLYTLNIMLNWFEYTFKDWLNFTVIFIIIYAIIAFVSMMRVKLSLDKINEKLNKKE